MIMKTWMMKRIEELGEQLERLTDDSKNEISDAIQAVNFDSNRKS